jgi:hypothetical protein
MARTGEILTGLGQAGSQVGEALLKVSMMRDQRQQRATSNALNMAQLDQAERRIDQDARQMEAAALRHEGLTAANQATARRAENRFLLQDIDNGLDLGDMPHAEALNKRMGGEPVGSWGDFNDSRAALRLRGANALAVESNINQAEQLNTLGITSSGQPHSTPGLTKEQEAQHGMRWIDADGTTFMSSMHSDWTPAEGERLFNHLQDMDLATLNEAERIKIGITEEALSDMDINFGERDGGGRRPFNPVAAEADPGTDPGWHPPNLLNFDVSGTATEQREGAGDPAAVDSTEITSDASAVDTLAPAFQNADTAMASPEDTATASPEGSLRMQAEHLMRTMPDNPQIQGMTLEQVIEWLGSAAKGSTP